MVSIIESSYFSKQAENSDKNFSSLTFTAEIRFIKFIFLLVANTRIGTHFESTTINKISIWFFLCFRVSEHFPITGILEFLYADNSMFTGQRSGVRIKLFQNCQRNNVTFRSGIDFV